ncbi:FtsH protease activity modulator HflK [Persicimonas caeni]|uniref:Protein HflK n=1 Tax=Persicimonas caeni TaxID=2292766 RepID=A0A4Y6PYG0_PERCE|nr:FtsH protease activity modulator HflK [Persicimonas caeni]QDG53351.1 FtsH protease activity modulator HflK [Persicimonas caeni]QED34572.1 FtsH protease activity modulator HflK [Persicimonas caeni]
MDFEERVIDLKNKKPEFELRPKLVAGIGVFLVAAIGIWGSWFQVEADSVGMVMRLGEYVRQTGPGLHFKLPYGIETVEKVPTEKQLKEEFGFRTAEAGVDTRYSSKDYPDESLMLTGDLNVVDLEWTVQYRIVDPEKFLFEVRHVRDTFRHMNEAVMREVVGDRTVNEVLTVGRTEIGDAVQQKLQKLADQYETGIRVDQVILQDITPPDPVKPSFNEVNQAQQQREQLINEAKADYNKAVPSARGEAQRTIQKAEGYAVNRVNRAKGEAARFNSLLEEYKKAPEVTRRRIYIETLGEVLPKAKRKVIIDGDTSNVVPLLPMGNGAMGEGGVNLPGQGGAKK